MVERNENFLDISNLVDLTNKHQAIVREIHSIARIKNRGNCKSIAMAKVPLGFAASLVEELFLE